MKIRYEFLDGQAVEVEAPENIGEIIIAIEHEEYNSNRRETRRHESYSDDNDKMERLVDPSADVEVAALCDIENRRLTEAIGQLLPQQQALIESVYFKGEKLVDITRRQGVSEGAIRDRLKKIHNRLKKLLS